MRKRMMLTVAYDGTNYHGWQIQPNGITIESELNGALSTLVGEPIKVSGASRTDTGVHSLGNLAVFDVDTRMPAEKISYALNQRLPADIRIQASREVPLDFHPRHCNSRKTYRYQILNSEFPLPTLRLYSYFVYTPLNIVHMQCAAAYLIGEHDFQSFCSADSTAETTVRTIYHICVEQKENVISIVVTGSGFLYNMVRIIAGTLIEIGKGRREPDEMTTILKACSRKAAGPTAPACGLTLLGIYLESEPAALV